MRTVRFISFAQGAEPGPPPGDGERPQRRPGQPDLPVQRPRTGPWNRDLNILRSSDGTTFGESKLFVERLRQTTDITVLLGEQNVTFALPHADRVYVLEHARIVWEGPPSRFVDEVSGRYI